MLFPDSVMLFAQMITGVVLLPIIALLPESVTELG
jgi:hypothetical protein